MKKIKVLLAIFFVLAFASCGNQSTMVENRFDTTQGIVLPTPSVNYIVIVDKNGNQYQTEIEDKILEDGSTISQKIQDCINNSKNHGDFVSCMAHLTNWLVKKGYITNKEKGIIMNIAARADIP